MSTRSTTHFTYGEGSEPVAIVYRHSDGYPSGAGIDIKKFLKQCSRLNDSRFDDPSYLAAKYVVFLADMFREPESMLEFLSVGVVREDPPDIEYRYVVNCGSLDPANGFPRLTGYSVSFITRKVTEVQIPDLKGEGE